ncbi:PorT family protein [Fulvivirga sp. RKSG066]|uniref:porin family protein n=1 Tax=Fulvivirga aurantia TaxID=2529383 RepID=UPI0012BBCF3E|nr:porin family protein [Fulvivirga aurantia]MTI23267.1 PorT family protein [Fulvivirga aurantia]
MKRPYLLLFIIFISVNYAISQGIGFRGGYSLASWDGFVLEGEEFNDESLNGFHVGIYGSLELGRSVFLEPGLFYSIKGESGSYVVDGTDFKMKNKSVYLDAPILIKYFIGGFNLTAGPQISLLLSNEVDLILIDPSSSQKLNFSEDTKDQFNEVDLSLVLGMGYRFINRVNLNINYDIGVSSALIDEESLFSQDNPGQYYSWIEASNRVLKLSIGITF